MSAEWDESDYRRQADADLAALAARPAPDDEEALREALLDAITRCLGLDPAEAEPAEVDDLMGYLLPVVERFAAEQVAVALASVLDLADELDREADTYAASVELLPTPTERASAAARAISHGGAAERIRARARAAAALATGDNDRRQG